MLWVPQTVNLFRTFKKGQLGMFQREYKELDHTNWHVYNISIHKFCIHA